MKKHLCTAAFVVSLFAPPGARAQDLPAAHAFMAQALPRGEATFDGASFVAYKGKACRSVIRFNGRELTIDWAQVTDTGWNSALLLTGRFELEPGRITQQRIELKSTDLTMRLSMAAETLRKGCDPTKGSGF